MIKKVIIAGLFLGGGIYAIRKLLPKYQKQEYKADIQEYEVKRFRSNPMGGGGRYTERNVRNSLPFNVLEKANQGNDISWGFDRYGYGSQEEGGLVKIGVKQFVL